MTDDTAAINAAISEGARCGEGCASTTVTPAVVYFPAGTYAISSSIIDFYYTSLVGDPNNPPTIKATAAFTGMGLINANPYFGESLNWGSTNVFFRQVRNFIIDTTAIPAASSIMGMHWPTSQATSLQDITFNLNAEAGTQHVGLFIESGSAGFLSDLTFNGGLIGAQVGNQQFTMRGLTFNNCVTAIWQLWSWSWTYIDININKCGTGINMSPAGPAGDILVGGVIIIDSTFTDTPIGISTNKTADPNTWTNGTLIIENVDFVNVPDILKGPATTFITGTTATTNIAGWGTGHEYTPTGPTSFQDTITGNTRPASLLGANGTRYYQMSKPQYQNLTAADFLSVRTAGAVGDGVTDDTKAVQTALDTAMQTGKVCFFDMGIYKLTSTITIPVGSRVVGEWFPVLLSSGEFFNDQTNPQPVVRLGNKGGDAGLIQWTDMIVSGQGSQEGAIMIEYNLAGTAGSGMWDVHTRIGGFAGTDLQVAECPKTSTGCLGAFMSIHITSGASNAYLENCWFWTADHDIDSDDNTQINVFTGRGMLVDNVKGGVWLVATAVEHHALYNYQFVGASSVFGAQLQTETPYYMPTPNALNSGYKYNATWSDPDYATSCATSTAANCAMAWGLRVVDSTDLMLYGSNHYSFFTSYSTGKSAVPWYPGSCECTGLTCDNRLLRRQRQRLPGQCGVYREKHGHQHLWSQYRWHSLPTGGGWQVPDAVY